MHYSRDFVRLNLEDSAQAIRDRWELQAPVFYFSRAVISKRETMEQLSMLLLSGAEAWEEDFILHELARILLLSFLKEGEHVFQPSHLRAGDFETFYRERDALVALSSEVAPVSSLLGLAGIRHVPLFRKRLHQLYDINIRGFITEVRMARAMSLLRDPVLSVKEIAYMTGFASAFYFSRVFSHYFGFPPKYFRREKNI
jgi:AraC-like DNA-binding protein